MSLKVPSPVTVRVASLHADIVVLRKSCAPHVTPGTVTLLREHRKDLQISNDGSTAAVQMEADWKDFKVSVTHSVLMEKQFYKRNKFEEAQKQVRGRLKAVLADKDDGHIDDFEELYGKKNSHGRQGAWH